MMLPITDATQGQSRFQSSCCCPEAPRKLEPSKRRLNQPKKRRPFARIGRYLGLIRARPRNAPQFRRRFLRGILAGLLGVLPAPCSLSFPAHAGNPVSGGLSVQSVLSRNPGSPGQAGRRQPSVWRRLGDNQPPERQITDAGSLCPWPGVPREPSAHRRSGPAGRCGRHAMKSFLPPSTSRASRDWRGSSPG